MQGRLEQDAPNRVGLQFDRDVSKTRAIFSSSCLAVLA